MYMFDNFIITLDIMEYYLASIKVQINIDNLENSINSTKYIQT